MEFGGQVKGAGEKMIASRIACYGSAAPQYTNPDIIAKYKATNLERYGVESPNQSVIVKQRKTETYQKLYGVKNPLSNGSKFRKRENLVRAGQLGYRATTKNSNSWILSKPEKNLIEYLRTRFKCVEQQVRIDISDTKFYLIDAYVSDIDTYVQLDGEFWHGLDKPYNELHEIARKRFDRDRQQDEWFRAHGKKLVRITDKEFLACQKEGRFFDIDFKLGG